MFKEGFVIHKNLQSMDQLGVGILCINNRLHEQQQLLLSKVQVACFTVVPD